MQDLISNFSKKFYGIKKAVFGKFIDKRIAGVVSYYKCSRDGYSCRFGEMSERFKEPVLKTGDVKASVGSNPTLSATII